MSVKIVIHPGHRSSTVCKSGQFNIVFSWRCFTSYPRDFFSSGGGCCATRTEEVSWIKGETLLYVLIVNDYAKWKMRPTPWFAHCQVSLWDPVFVSKTVSFVALSWGYSDTCWAVFIKFWCWPGYRWTTYFNTMQSKCSLSILTALGFNVPCTMCSVRNMVLG